MVDSELRNLKIPLQTLMELTEVSSLIKAYINQPVPAPSFSERKFTIPSPITLQTYEKPTECCDRFRSIQSKWTKIIRPMPTSSNQELEPTDYLAPIQICKMFQARLEADLLKAFIPETLPDWKNITLEQ